MKEIKYKKEENTIIEVLMILILISLVFITGYAQGKMDMCNNLNGSILVNGSCGKLKVYQTINKCGEFSILKKGYPIINDIFIKPIDNTTKMSIVETLQNGTEPK